MEQAYTTDDIKGIIEPASSNIELYLKSVVFPSVNPRAGFASLIAMLTRQSISQSSTDALDGLRLFYNNLKHQPGADGSLIIAIDHVKSAMLAIMEINTSGLGATAQLETTVPRYTLWVACWDHYIHGDTEIAIMIPEEVRPYGKAVDHISVEMKSWDDIKSALTATGHFHWGEDRFSKEVINSFVKEGDFLSAGIWDGPYRELVTIFAKYEKVSHREDLLPGLRRQDTYWSVGTGLIMAVLDVLGKGVSPDDITFHEDVLEIADMVFAIPKDGAGVKGAVDQLINLVKSVPSAQRNQITGPLLKPDEAKEVSDHFNVWIDGGAIAIGPRIPVKDARA